MPKQNTIRALTTVALDGYSLEINAHDYTLMAISQIAAALRPAVTCDGENCAILDDPRCAPPDDRFSCPQEIVGEIGVLIRVAYHR